MITVKVLLPTGFLGPFCDGAGIGLADRVLFLDSLGTAVVTAARYGTEEVVSIPPKFLTLVRVRRTSMREKPWYRVFGKKDGKDATLTSAWPNRQRLHDAAQRAGITEAAIYVYDRRASARAGKATDKVGENGRTA